MREGEVICRRAELGDWRKLKESIAHEYEVLKVTGLSERQSGQIERHMLYV